MYRFVLLIFLFLSPLVTLAKTDTTSVRVDSTRRNTLLPVPIFNYTPETGYSYGLSGLYSFYTSRYDRNTRPSYAFAAANYTQRKQTILYLYANTWTKDNRYHIISECQYNDFNFYYYGIGNETRRADQVLVKEKKLDLYLQVERKVYKAIYAGVDINYRREIFPDLPDVDILDPQNIVGTQGGGVPKGGVSIVYDSRDINTYTSSGRFGRLLVGHTLDFLGSTYSFTQVNFEFSSFHLVHPRLVLAFNVKGESIMGNVPFYELRPMGNHNLMRGYIRGRYRDNTYMATQVESRFQILPRWMLVAFVGAGSLFSPSDQPFYNIKPNYGVGVRFRWDKISKLNIRFDYGWGEKPKGEKRLSSYYLLASEAF